MKALLLLLCATCAAAPLRAVDPVTAAEAAAAAKGSLPGLVRAGKGVVEVPKQAAQVLRLPLGLVEMLCSPLPEVTFMEGLTNTGKGLTGAFKLCVATLEMPAELFGGAGDALKGWSL